MQFFIDPSAEYAEAWGNHYERTLDLFFCKNTVCSESGRCVRTVLGEFSLCNSHLVSFDSFESGRITAETGTQVVRAFLESRNALELEGYVDLVPFQRGLSLNYGFDRVDTFDEEFNLQLLIGTRCCSDRTHEIATMILCWYVVACHDGFTDIWMGEPEEEVVIEEPEPPAGPTGQAGNAEDDMQIPAEDVQAFIRAAEMHRQRYEMTHNTLEGVRGEVRDFVNDIRPEITAFAAEYETHYNEFLATSRTIVDIAKKHLEDFEQKERELQEANTRLGLLQLRIDELEAARPAGLDEAAGGDDLSKARRELLAAQRRATALEDEVKRLAALEASIRADAVTAGNQRDTNRERMNALKREKETAEEDFR